MGSSGVGLPWELLEGQWHTEWRGCEAEHNNIYYNNIYNIIYYYIIYYIILYI